MNGAPPQQVRLEAVYWSGIGLTAMAPPSWRRPFEATTSSRPAPGPSGRRARRRQRSRSGHRSPGSRRAPRGGRRGRARATTSRRSPSKEHRRRRPAAPEHRPAVAGSRAGRRAIAHGRVQRRHRQAPVPHDLHEDTTGAHQHQRTNWGRARCRARSRPPAAPSARPSQQDRATFEIRVGALERGGVVDATRTPPTSDLCCTPGLAVFTATGNPIRSAPAIASRACRHERSRPPARRSRPARPARRARRTAPRSTAAAAIARARRRGGRRARDRLACSKSRLREQVFETGEPRERPSSNGIPVAVEQLGVVPVDAAREVREHREGLAGLGEGSRAIAT